jgi:DTW domain-containing protein YfiP
MPTIDPSSNCHTAQWERQSTWLAHLREHKQKLQACGVNGFDLLEAMATLSIHHKLDTCTKDRCETCWHAKLYCICGQLKQIVFKQEPGIVVPNVKILILMHHKEYMSAGNSAKLLLQLFPLSTELYIFGKEGDVDRLFQDITSNPKVTKSIILWPGKEAMSTADLLRSLKDEQSTTSYSRATNNHTIPTIHAIVLDGTYNQARNMYKSLKKKWRHTNNIPTAVSLQPILESVFHRAQKNYGKAHLQHQGMKNEDTVLRVCTAEACGVLLHELGVGDQDLMERVMDAVRLNNDALKYSRHHLTNC